MNIVVILFNDIFCAYYIYMKTAFIYFVTQRIDCIVLIVLPVRQHMPVFVRILR